MATARTPRRTALPTVADRRASPAPDPTGVKPGALRRARWRLATFSPGALSERLDEWLEVRDCRHLLQEARADRTAWPPSTDGDVPLVSVCIPTYVRDRELLLRAVRAALAQTHPRIE